MADNLTPVLNALQQQFGALGGQAGAAGARQFGLGTDALGQMLNQFTKMSQGSSANLLASTPETQSVMSQYDSARNAMANLSPRGGMRASQGANLKFGELGQLGQLVQGARQGAAGAAEQAATGLAGAGTAEQNIANQYIESVMKSQLERRQQNKDTALSHFTNALATAGGEAIGGVAGGKIGTALGKLII